MKLDMFNDFDPTQYLYCSVGVAILGSAAVGAASTAYGASKASKAQQNAAATAADMQMNMYKKTRKDLEPYRDAGARYSEELETRMPYLTSDINIDDELARGSTVRNAYDFTRTQGLKAAQNSAAARGLGVSGAALKGASAFATGFANNTYKDLFAMENINRTNAYERLKGLVTIGQNAAAQTGAQGTTAAANAGAATIAGGNAAAAGYNAMGAAVKGFASDVGGYAAYKGLYGGQPATPSGTPAGYNWNGTGFTANQWAEAA